jgi:hypothetical protein
MRFWVFGPNDQEFNSQQGKRFCLIQNAETGCGAHPVSCSFGSWGYFPSGKVTGAKLTTHFHIVTALGVGETKPLLPLCVLMACEGTANIEIIFSSDF